MAYEVDILAVGEESKSGDAIALRFGNLPFDPKEQFIVVIDGGFNASGKKLVERIKNEYDSTYVDLVISTHPDSDHINGLRVVLEELSVGQLWMHTPWNISEDVKRIAEVRSLKGSQFESSDKIKKSLQAAYDLEQLAIKKGVKIIEPFEGQSEFNNTIHILGPHLDYYYELTSQFDYNRGISSVLRSFLNKIKETITDHWDKDQLEDPAEDAVSARNNSSVIVIANLGKTFLFLGDSGVPAIQKAADYAQAKGFDMATDVHYIQVPHHGSKRNLGPTILDRIIGPKVPKGVETGKIAFISAAVGHPKHPSKRVKNALIRRGLKVSETCGQDHCFKSSDVPMRSGWEQLTYVDFCETYEEE